MTARQRERAERPLGCAAFPERRTMVGAGGVPLGAATSSSHPSARVFGCAHRPLPAALFASRRGHPYEAFGSGAASPPGRASDWQCEPRVSGRRPGRAASDRTGTMFGAGGATRVWRPRAGFPRLARGFDCGRRPLEPSTASLGTHRLAGLDQPGLPSQVLGPLGPSIGARLTRMAPRTPRRDGGLRRAQPPLGSTGFALALPDHRHDSGIPALTAAKPRVFRAAA